MNKFTKALLLSLFFAAPVAMSAPAVQAKTVGNQPQQVAQATTKKHRVKKHRVRHARRHAAANQAVKK